MVYGDKGKPLSLLGAAEQAMYDRMMLENLATTSVMDRYATITKTMGQNESTELKFEKWITLKDSLLATNINESFSGKDVTATGIETLVNVGEDDINNFILTEGSSGTAGGEMKIVETSATVFPFGKFMQFTEELKTFHKRWRLEEASKQFGEVAGLLIDGFYRDLYRNGAGHLIDISAAASGANSVLDNEFSAAFSRMALLLKLSGAKQMNSMMSSSVKIGTIPVESCYMGVCHPIVADALENGSNPDFIPKRLYADGTTLLPGEIGMLKKIRLVENENAWIENVSGSSFVTDVVIFGKDHTAHVPLRGKGRAEMIIKGIGSSGTQDPLDRIGTVGFKGWIGAKVLYPERIGKVKALVTFA